MVQAAVVVQILAEGVADQRAAGAGACPRAAGERFACTHALGIGSDRREQGREGDVLVRQLEQEDRVDDVGTVDELVAVQVAHLASAVGEIGGIA